LERIELQIYTPVPETKPGEQSPADDEVPATELRAVLAEENIQDVLFEPPPDEESVPESGDGVPLVLVFDMKAADIDMRVAEACESTYIHYGTAGLHELGAAFHGTGRELGGGLGAIGMLLPAEARGEPLYLGPERSPKRHRLVQGFDGYTRTLPEKRSRAEAAVQEAARSIAETRLAESRKQVLAEAVRYLSLGELREARAAAFLSGGSRATLLSGPDVLPLAAGLLRIAHARRSLEDKTRRQREAVEEWERAKLQVIDEDLTRRRMRQGYLSEREILEAYRAARLFGESESIRQAREQVQGENAALAELVARLGAEFPVIFRLWDTEAPFEVERALTEGEAANVRSLDALQRSTELRNAVVDLLHATWAAAGDLRGKIQADAADVWKYEPLIDEALEALHLDQGHFAWRAAQERQAEEGPPEELLRLSRWLGAVGLAGSMADIAAAAAGVVVLGAATIAVAIELVDVAVSAYLVIDQAIGLWQQELAYKAFLNPSRSLAVEQSYSALAIDVFFLALSIRGMKGAVGAPRGTP
jgi:hypothetical protein